jgi:hypothetical protein
VMTRRSLSIARSRSDDAASAFGRKQQ